jgi:hypothetical protein
MRNTTKAALVGMALGLSFAVTAGAETVTTTTKTTTYSGTVSEINPSASTIILKSESSPSPVTYTYSKETSFVDASGNVVSYEALRNAPVRVEYEMDNGRTIVRRVVQTGPATMVQPQVVVPAPPAAVPGGMIHREKTTTHTETDD